MTDTTSLDTHALLLDARLRVLNRERVTPEDMRRILLSIAHDRENAARAGARNRAAARKAVAAPKLDIDTLFGDTKMTESVSALLDATAEEIW